MLRFLSLLALIVSATLSDAADPPKPETPSPVQSAPVFSAVEKFDRAVDAYQAGKYNDAHKDLLELVKEGHLSAALAHDLANLEYRLGHPGQAILWYRRALAMRPYSPETLQNLRFLRRQNGFLTWYPYGISLSHLPLASVKNTTITAGWILIIVISWILWAPPRRGLRWPLITLLLLALPVLSAGTGLWWFLQNDSRPLNKRQIITGNGTNAYAAPAEAASSVITLPTGSELVPLEVRGNWTYCDIPTEDTSKPVRGWVRSAELEPLWPWPANPRD